MVTRSPGQSTSAVETLASVMRDEPKPIAEILTGIPAELDRLVRRCLRKDPAKRWQTMSDVKLTLEELRVESDSGRLVAPGTPRAGVASRVPRDVCCWPAWR